MASKRRVIYWDACVFLSYLNKYPVRFPIIERLLRDSGNRLGDIEIVTSVLSVTEVAYIAYEKANGALDPAAERKLNSFWSDRSAIKLIDLHELISLQSRDLIRRAMLQGGHLRAADAIHLASAMSRDAEEVHTYDERLDKYASIVGRPIVRPYVTPNPLPTLPGFEELGG